MTIEDAAQIEFKSRTKLRNWLQKNHQTAAPFWLVTYKKHIARYYVPYGEIVEELLCFAWIDSRTRRLDDDRTMLFVGPRKPGSTWSAANKERIEKLTENGLMQTAGLESIESARADGSWTFLDDIEKLVMPDDLKVALEGNPEARKQFEGFNRAAKKLILYWIKSAKRESTRQTRVSETVRLAAKGLKAAHPEAKGQ